LLADSVKISLREYLIGLSKRGVENRPIVSGNFARQPGLALFDSAVDWRSLAGAERIHNRGFFIGLHVKRLDTKSLFDLANRLLSF
jgi:CDP-6-deoxy-D-xylo-4-hexulose-3-dehydrase